MRSKASALSLSLSLSHSVSLSPWLRDVDIPRLFCSLDFLSYETPGELIFLLGSQVIMLSGC